MVTSAPCDPWQNVALNRKCVLGAVQVLLQNQFLVVSGLDGAKAPYTWSGGDLLTVAAGACGHERRGGPVTRGRHSGRAREARAAV